MASGKIFISYRREDTSGESGRLKDKLQLEFGEECIFYDVETLEAGLNFDQAISRALEESKVLLAMIGPHWLKVTDSRGIPRINNPEDWVRKEISLGLQRQIRVIPVLVNGANMPTSEELPNELKGLSLIHYKEISSSRWNYDVGELIKVLKKLISTIGPLNQERKNPLPIPVSLWSPPSGDWVNQYRSWWSRNYKWALTVFALILLMQLCSDLSGI
ncbi:toll/interleukin-1 receptor domain-containing protein [Algoriphagus sp. A40]|uniref:toll/interleukin-1 receptor domain-containing protein n=1 Tax=Algoriphagus sp. A40 TaxID=1945863 RepID=UPI0009879306|nr:toll/interleukin-1 receptor domain-containing protein [Algoriphagus sp. A40]OOG78261.1 hypothetical protein B0E43_02330 [Algoriphagus sp. A40]